MEKDREILKKSLSLVGFVFVFFLVEKTEKRKNQISSLAFFR